MFSKDIVLSKDIILPLPKEIIRQILLFDKRFAFVKGKIRLINRLSLQDKRYNILNSIPQIVLSKDMYNSISFVYLPINETSEFHLVCTENIIVLEKIMYSPRTSKCCCGKITNCNIIVRQ